MRGTRRKGFSLLELLVVIAIILIIATIAIPSLMRSRQRSNEIAAVAGLRAVSSAQIAYGLTAGGGYASLRGLVRARLLDQRFGRGVVDGYRYSIVRSGPFSYTARAIPVSLNNGRYGYYMPADGVIRYSMSATLSPAGQTGQPVK